MPAILPFLGVAAKVAAGAAAVKSGVDAFKKPAEMSLPASITESAEDVAKKKAETAKKASLLRQGEMTQTQYGGLGSTSAPTQKRSLLGGV